MSFPPSCNLLVIRIYYSKYLELLFLFQLFTNYFSRPIKSIFHGSVEFNFTVRALGQKLFLTFFARGVTGKTILGGKKCSFYYFVIIVIVAVVVGGGGLLLPLLLLLLKGCCFLCSPSFLFCFLSSSVLL